MKRNTKHLLAGVSVCIWVLILSGCAPKQPVQATAYALGTILDIQAYGPEAQTGIDAAFAHISGRDALWSTRFEDSEVSRINREGKAAVSPETYDLIASAHNISESLFRDTQAVYFDITVYPLVQLYGIQRGGEPGFEFVPPGNEQVEALLPYVDYRQVSLDRENFTVELPEGLGIDLGGIAKGRCADESAQILRDHDITSALINLGGNIYTVGLKPDGKDWRIGIRNPLSEDANAVFAELPVGADTAVVTSGDYQRYTNYQGRRYHHILDPRTGYPADNGLASVTVVCGESTLADALSTAFFVAGVEKGMQLCENFLVEAIFVTKDGKVYITEGLREAFTITDSAFILQDS